MNKEIKKEYDFLIDYLNKIEMPNSKKRLIIASINLIITMSNNKGLIEGIDFIKKLYNL